jgi:hypothetical protein
VRDPIPTRIRSSAPFRVLFSNACSISVVG